MTDVGTAVATALYAVWNHGGWGSGGWGPWGGGFGFGWFFGPILGLFWLAVAAFVIWFIWRGRRGGGVGWSATSPTQRAKDILAERYARGEVSTEEYRERLEQLG